MVLDYFNQVIRMVAGNSKLPSILRFPWGEGRHRAKLLHRGYMVEEQNVVLEEELKTLEKKWDPNIRVVVEKYIRSS
jgi:hypothetical protein